MIVRYFGAARAATGRDDEHFDLPPGTTLNDLLLQVVKRHPSVPDAPQPSMSAVVTRSSFLRNEVAVRDRTTRLDAADTIDVLPPFAGG